MSYINCRIYIDGDRETIYILNKYIYKDTVDEEDKYIVENLIEKGLMKRDNGIHYHGAYTRIYVYDYMKSNNLIFKHNPVNTLPHPKSFISFCFSLIKSYKLTQFRRKQRNNNAKSRNE